MYFVFFFWVGELEEKPSTGVWAICGTSLPVLLVGPVVFLFCFFNSEGEQRAARTLGSLFLFIYLFSKCNRRYLKLSPSPINSLWTDHQVALSGSFFKILDLWSIQKHFGVCRVPNNISQEYFYIHGKIDLFSLIIYPSRPLWFELRAF